MNHIAHWTLIATLAGLAGCSSASGTPEDSNPEIVHQYMELGMSEPMALACADLSGVLGPEKADGTPGPEELTDDAGLALWWTRRDFRQIYCDEFSAMGSGWEHCIQEATPITNYTATPACIEQALPYIECLARAATTTRDDCKEFVPSPGCDPTVPVRAGAPADDYCGPGGATSIDGEACPCAPGEQCECETRLRYGHKVNTCPDGSSYEYYCTWPDESCAISCECRIDDVTVKQALIENVNASFEQKVWDACGFPEIPADVVAEWEAARPTQSVYEDSAE